MAKCDVSHPTKKKRGRLEKDLVTGVKRTSKK
jgi:hypothetical protein